MIGQFIQRLHQGVAPERSMANGGGSSGGSSGTPYYANQDRLFGTNADISQALYNQYASLAPGYLQNSLDMTNEAMDGTLANRMRQQAGNDAQASMGAALDGNNRNMQRYGMGMSANRLASEGNRNAIMGAGLKSAAMNQAGSAAEEMKWNRNAGAYGQIAGMGTGAMQGMQASGSGYGSMANAQNANAAANAAGYGKFGSSIASGMLFKADGGEVKKPGLKLAQGAYVRGSQSVVKPAGYRQQVLALPTVDWRSQPTSGGENGGKVNPFMATLSGAAPLLIGAGLKEYGRPLANEGWQAAKGFYNEMTAPHASEFTVPEQTFDTSEYDIGWDGGNTEYTWADGGEVPKRGLHLASGGDVDPLPEVRGTANPESGPRSVGSRSRGVTPTQGLGMANTAKNLFNWGKKGYNAYTKVGAQNSLNSASASGGQQAAIDYGMATGVGTEAMSNGTVSALGEGGVNAGSEQAATLAAQDAAVEGTNTSATGAAGSSMLGGNWGGAAISGAINAMQAQYTPNDPDGFGTYTPDYRHAVGSGVLSYYIPYVGGAVADIIHPVMEPLSRAMINAGDEIGGAGGALLLDPVGTVVSGKYSPEEIVKGAVFGPAAEWFDFADGGRVNMKPGGPVAGPGTETSDDIPAWLSDGEFVLNAEAVKMIGKAKLEKLNAQGLKKREGKPTPKGKGRGLKLAKGGAAKKGC